MLKGRIFRGLKKKQTSQARRTGKFSCAAAASIAHASERRQQTSYKQQKKCIKLLLVDILKKFLFSAQAYISPRVPIYFRIYFKEDRKMDFQNMLQNQGHSETNKVSELLKLFDYC